MTFLDQLKEEYQRRADKKAQYREMEMKAVIELSSLPWWRVSRRRVLKNQIKRYNEIIESLIYEI